MELQLSDPKNLEDLFLAGWSSLPIWVLGARSDEQCDQLKHLNIDHVVASHSVQRAIINVDESARKRARRIVAALRDFKTMAVSSGCGITNGNGLSLSSVTGQFVSKESFKVKLKFSTPKRREYRKIIYL
ncbi:hypothetical protein GNI_090510 [Gregarina niphandrodes]|uniref:Uncharacterized protein n=1 Tax=Gregarina niphandrodes TaxID=110365 RepID=A0A023B5I2_GRENI|nr:hypothetical protein GNI_090510 [Gregarina niphandrodes]EZG60421.1 hypothetical protein GNI_090510 [Gregarina niphandrodes]|eukprot:XP_011130829.1 hypothetical protein GNI_090510 [Gregarina niphandrodes]